MPELPEVETLRQQLNTKVLGQTIEKIEVLHLKSVAHDADFARVLTGTSIESIDRIGKLLIFKLSSPDTYILGHMKMTGQLIFREGTTMVGGGHTVSDGDLVLPNKHTRVVFTFAGGAMLFFNDMRLFGYLKRATEEEVDAAKQGFGIEPMTNNYTWESFQKLFGKRTTSIKALLLNQKLISGLGNIYVDEACFRSGIRPTRRVNTITPDEQKKLFKACEQVLKDAIAAGGTTFRSFSDTDGKRGNFTKQLQVFHREGQPCLVCGEEILKIREAGRGTHYCPQCQV